MLGEVYGGFRTDIGEEEIRKGLAENLIIPDYIYNKRELPQHLTGGLYILPFSTIGCLFSSAMVRFKFLCFTNALVYKYVKETYNNR